MQVFPSLVVIKDEQGQTQVLQLTPPTQVGSALKPGDKIIVELSDGKHRELTLSGYMHDVTGFPFGFTNTMDAYVTPKTL